jgi:hypothetical protein
MNIEFSGHISGPCYPGHKPLYHNAFLDAPYIDGMLNLGNAFQEGPSIHFEGLTTANGRISEDVSRRCLAERVGLAFVGALLLFPGINIVIDIALRFFVEKANEFAMKQRSTLEDRANANPLIDVNRYLNGLTADEVLGGSTGLLRSLNSRIAPRIIQMIRDSGFRDGSFSYATVLEPDPRRYPPVGTAEFILHLKMNLDGKSVQWSKRVISYTAQFIPVRISEEEIVRDVARKVTTVLWMRGPRTA